LGFKEIRDMAQKIIVEQAGGIEQLKLVAAEVGAPGPGEVRIRHHAIGVNFIDVYQRSGMYPLPMPLALGMEGAGVVEAVGDGVAHLRVGDRAAYASQPPGSYCDVRVMPAKCVCKLPDAIDFDTAAAMMLKGLTVQYLLRRTQPHGGDHGGLKPGDFVLWHAAAGGVGLIACQWAKAMGLQLIGTASTDEKCALAKANGAAHVINYSKENFTEVVQHITAGRGVKVVYDSVGSTTWDGSIDCLQPFGLMVSFGNASGPVPPVSLSALAAKGSLHVTRPTLFSHMATRETTQGMFDDLAQMVGSGAVKLQIDQRYPLKDAGHAHRDLESRKTVGSLLLIP
jgi:NADPH:quinone reductase